MQHSLSDPFDVARGDARLVWRQLIHVRTGHALLIPSERDGSHHLAQCFREDAPNIPFDTTTLLDFASYTFGRAGTYASVVGFAPNSAHPKVEDAPWLVERCIRLLSNHGELVMAMPISILTNSNAGQLREAIADRGSITHIVTEQDDMLLRFVRSAHTSTVRFSGSLTSSPP